MIELGSEVEDKATGLKGMVTCLQIEMNKSVYYTFQPKGLNPKTGQPVEGMWLVEERLTGGARIDMPDLPVNVLGTIVEDKASGFKGLAVSLVYHLNGCVHFNIQPQGLQETGAPIETHNFDIRRLTGEAIKPMTKEVKKADEKERPSPTGSGCYSPARTNNNSCRK
jgi:hypothetical protein